MLRTVTIKNVVDTGINGTLTISFEGYADEHIFNLNSLSDLERAVKLSHYLKVRYTDDLKGKTTQVIESGNTIVGFGHPMEDKFFPLSGEFQELTAAEFEKLLK